MLQAIGRGESHITLPNIEADDELGELSRSFQKSIKRLQLFNELRTSKITELRRVRNRILDEISETVIIIDPDFKIKTINEAGKELLHIQGETIKASLKDFKDLWKHLSEVLNTDTLKGKREILFKTRNKTLKNKIATILPVFESLDQLDQIIIIIK